MSESTGTVQTLVVLTTGKEDRGTRATLAFSWACTALAMGQPTALFCTMQGTVWAQPKSAATTKVEGFEPLSVYIEQFLALGGRMLVCAPCSEYYCAADPAAAREMLFPEAELAGLTTVVSLIHPGSTVVTF